MSITLRNTLTGKEWHFYMPAGLTALGSEVEEADGTTIQIATFNDFEQGLYSVINDGATDVQVILWGKTYTVGANSKWDFMAHSEVESISPLVARTANERYRGEPPPEPPVEPPVEPPPDNGTDTTAGGADSIPASASTAAPNP